MSCVKLGIIYILLDLYMTKAISIDIGYQNLGFSVISAEYKGKNLQLLYAENFVTTEKLMPDKLREIAEHFKKLIKEYDPEIFVYEDPVMKGEIGSKLMQVVGVLRLLANKFQLQEFAYKPTTVKLVVAGKGTANKDEMIAAVSKIFPERVFLKKENHACDSVSCGLCWVHKFLM